MRSQNVRAMLFGFLGAGIFVTVFYAGPAVAQNIKEFIVRLQAATPGSQQTGNANISGKFIAGMFEGDGMGLTNLNASNLSSGTVPSGRLPVPMSLFLDDMGQSTLTVENVAASSTALTVLGKLVVGPAAAMVTDPITGNIVTVGTVTADQLISAAGTKVGGDLDMTGGAIANIGTSGSAFRPNGGLEVKDTSSISIGGSNLNIGNTGMLISSDLIEVISSAGAIFLTSPLLALQGDLTTIGPAGSHLLRADHAAGETVALRPFRFADQLFDGFSSAGNLGQTLMSTSDKTKWVNLFGADGKSIIIDGDAEIGGDTSPRIFTVERTLQKVTTRGVLENLTGGICTDNAVAFKTFSGTAPTSTHIRSPGTDILAFFTGNAERMRVSQNGRVSINGTTGNGNLNVFGTLFVQGSPGSIFSNDTTFSATGGSGRGFAFVNGGWAEQRARNANGMDVFLVTGPASGFVNGFASGVINNSGGTLNAGFFRNQGTNTADMFANGVKSFVEPNPDNPSTDIYYAAMEGPEAGMYVRGTARLVNGRAIIRLPDHFTALADDQGMTVQLTPLSFKSKGMAVGNKSLFAIEVGELQEGRGSYEFDWEVKAVRKKYRNYKVLRPWDDLVLPDADRTKAWEARMKQMQTGG